MVAAGNLLNYKVKTKKVGEELTSFCVKCQMSNCQIGILGLLLYGLKILIVFCVRLQICRNGIFKTVVLTVVDMATARSRE